MIWEYLFNDLIFKKSPSDRNIVVEGLIINFSLWTFMGVYPLIPNEYTAFLPLQNEFIAHDFSNFYLKFIDLFLSEHL